MAIGQPGKLSERAKQIIQADSNQLLLSAASLWEIALKVRAGKLRLPERPDFFISHMANLGVEVLPIDGSQVLGVLGLPDHHRDPFDRLLIAQCQAEQLVFLSGDEVARRYAV